MFIRFRGARKVADDDGNTKYEPREDIMINLEHVTAFYDHTIMTSGSRIIVMDSLEEIRKKVTEE